MGRPKRGQKKEPAATGRQAGAPQAAAGPQRRLSGIFATAAFAVVLSSFFYLGLNAVQVFCFSSVDSFWLIETGLAIIERASLPTQDIYSFTAAGEPWLIYQWLFEVSCGLVHRLGGLQALQAAVMLLCAALFAVIAMQEMIRGGSGFWPAWLTCFSAYCASFSFLSLRPHIVSLLAVYILSRILERHWLKPGWWIMSAVPLFLIWANSHIMFALGLAIFLAYFLAAGLSYMRVRNTPAAPASWQRFRLLGVSLVAAVAACLANPYGWDIISYGLSVSSQSYWVEHIGEVKTPEFSDPVGGLILNYILLTVLSFVLSTRRPHLADGLVYMLLLSAGLTSYKLLPYFVAATMHGTALRLNDGLSRPAGQLAPAWLSQASSRLATLVLSPLYAVLMLAIALVAGLTKPVLFPPWVPVRACDYIEKHPLKGKTFCSAKLGSYIIYRFHGRLKVFIDTRFDMYGQEFSSLYFRAHREGAGLSELFARYGIESAFVEPGSAAAAVLSRSPGWRKVYADASAAVFEKERAG